ncbi:MAG: DUF4906 domain-containing protein [Rikenellaceae bacterium]
MRRKIIMAIAAVATLVGCNIEKFEETTIITKPEQENFDDLYAQGWMELEGQTARLAVSFEAEEQTTRSSGTTMERTINDINIYLFSETFDISQRLYLNDSSSLVLPITPGDWKVYAIANYGEDMGERSEESLQSLNYEINSESDLSYNSQLLMTHESIFTVDDTLSLSVLLSRVVARIDVSVNLTSAAVGNVTLQSIRLVNAPKRCTLFGEVGSLSSSDLMTYEYQDCSDKSTFSIYMLENLSGENTAITDEGEKCEANAPSTAAYLEITGTTIDAWVTYRVYLGRNNTSDFNVDRNTIYEVEAAIYGTESEDLRVDVIYFPVSATITLSSVHMEIYKERAVTDMFSSYEVTYSVVIAVSKALKYDVEVVFEPLIYSNGSYAAPTTNPIILETWSVTIPAGSTTASKSYIYFPIIANYVTHGRLVSVTKTSTSDNNSYTLNTSPVTCTENTTSVVL